MLSLSRCAVLAAALGGAAQPVVAQRTREVSTAPSAGTVTQQLIEAQVRFLADDLLEGRAPGTRGGDLAARYLASEFAGLGLKPGAPDGSFYQWVSLAGLTSEGSIVVGAQRSTLVLEPGSDVVAWPERVDSATTLDADLVFAGYGVSAPEWGWDDYKGRAQTGRIVVVLPSEPRGADSAAFRGRALTVHGLWQRKLDEAARMGAVGVLLVHAADEVPLTWAAVRNTWGGEHLLPDRPPTQSLRFAAWISSEAARRIVEATGKDYALLLRRAASPDFRPVELGARAAVDLHSQLRHFRAPNVIARLDGADSTGRAEAVVVTAHYDHLGSGRLEGTDSIFNGAVDNASGVALLLATATALARAPGPPTRSVVWLAATAAEAGGLGAATYVTQPAFPLNRTAAVLGVDGGNVWGPTSDIVGLGAELSTLGDWMAAAAQAESLAVAPDPNPQLGDLYRSDLLAFAQAGVPVVLLQPGPTYVDRDANWGREQWRAYLSDRYHRPGDGVRPDFDYRGLVQQARVLTRLAWSLAETLRFPDWYPDAEFRAAGQLRRRMP
jgi:Zn-dependent M28 family amino/carboxypeptidase